MLEGSLSSIDVVLWDRQIAHILAPTLRTVATAVVGRCQHRGSTASTDEVEVTLTLTHELMTTLVDDDLLVYTVSCSQTSTSANLVHIACSLAGASTSLQQQLSSVEQHLRITIDTEVVVEAEVGISLLVLVVALAAHILIYL